MTDIQTEICQAAETRLQEVERALSSIRPAMEADGGGCQLVGVEDDGTVKIRLRGTCLVCPSADLTLRLGIEATLKSKLPWVARVVRG